MSVLSARSATLFVLAALLVAQTANPAETGSLRAGASRVVTTPSADMLPDVFEVVHDDLHVRALFLENESSRAIVVAVEAPMIHGDIARQIVDRLTDEYDVPADYVVLTVTHTHSAPRVAPLEQYINVPNADQLSKDELDHIRETVLHRIPVNDAFNAHIVEAVYDTVRQAHEDLQPAVAGFGTGNATIVASRNEWLESRQHYIDGIDRSGTQPVDQTLAVQTFESLSGDPIAVLVNYGIEPVVAPHGVISGDVPGVASRHLEKVLGGEAVALFTIGAAESPRYRVWPESDRDPEDAFAIMQAMGVILGEETLAVASAIHDKSSSLTIVASSDSLTCPGKITAPRNLRTQCAYTDDSELPACTFTDTDIDPVTMSMGLLRLGNVAYVTTIGNVVPALSQKLQRRSPLANTFVLSANFGAFRFIVDDAAYGLNTYPATDTRAKKGCAEQGFLNSAINMITDSF